MFLPFTPSARELELLAIEVKAKLSLGPYESVDPYAVLDAVPARLLTPNDLSGCSSETRRALLYSSEAGWSAIAYGQSPASGEWLILLNRRHHRHRQRVSLMEEIVHIVREHPPTELRVDGLQTPTRSYQGGLEDEAYTVGAACIIPYSALFTALHTAHEDISVLAERFDVSQQYVRFRINRAGLARIYAKHCREFVAAGKNRDAISRRR